jgi:hypothetical protein
MASFETVAAQKQRAARPVFQRRLASTGYFVAFRVQGHRSLPASRTILAGESGRNLAGEEAMFPGLVAAYLTIRSLSQ